MKYIVAWLWVIISLLGVVSFVTAAAGGNIDNTQYGVDPTHFSTLTQDDQDFAVTDDINIIGDDATALRQGTYNPVSNVDTKQGKVEELKQYQNGQIQTIQLIKNIINYILGSLGAIILIMFIYYGFRFITGADEDVISVAGKKMKTAAIAGGGIALSWMIVTFIFYVITTIK